MVQAYKIFIMLVIRRRQHLPSKNSNISICYTEKLAQLTPSVQQLLLFPRAKTPIILGASPNDGKASTPCNFHAKGRCRDEAFASAASAARHMRQRGDGLRLAKHLQRREA
jgi:hypothetical protein